VIFDSADVLVRPVLGREAPADEAWRRWFPGPRFEQLLERHGVEVAAERLDDALSRGMAYLDAEHAKKVMTVDDERRMFERFYRLVLAELGALDPPPAAVAALARAKVDEEEIEPYEDVVAVLRRLHERGLVLALLSEAWPSLVPKYERLGLRSAFSAFVVSSQEGRLKSDPDLFEAVRSRLGLRPDEALYIDDWPPHVETAVALGFRGVVVDRLGDAPRGLRVPYVSSLEGVEELLS
jgi:putative hydrolase of the HAD superfamily